MLTIHFYMQDYIHIIVVFKGNSQSENSMKNGKDENTTKQRNKLGKAVISPRIISVSLWMYYTWS